MQVFVGTDYGFAAAYVANAKGIFAKHGLVRTEIIEMAESSLDLVGWLERSETHHVGRGLHSTVGFAALNPPYG